MDCSTPGFPVHHQLPELAQTHVHESVMPSWVLYTHVFHCKFIATPEACLLIGGAAAAQRLSALSEDPQLGLKLGISSLSNPDSLAV